MQKEINWPAWLLSGIAIIGIVVTLGAQLYRIDANDRKDAIDHPLLFKVSNENYTSIAELRKDIQYIRETSDRIYMELQQLKKERKP